MHVFKTAGSIVLAVTSSIALFAHSTHAASPATTQFDVRLTIENACTVDTPADLDFGTQGSLSTVVPILGQTTITVTCTPTTAYSVGLEGGQNGDVNDREMAGTVTTAEVDYVLSRTASPVLTNWGNTPGVDTVDAIGTGLPVPHIVFGSVPTQATPAPDVFTDTIIVNVTF